MSKYNTTTDKTVAQLFGFDETILEKAWEGTGVCPSCECESSIKVGAETQSDNFVEVEDCELCNAVLQAVVGDSFE